MSHHTLRVAFLAHVLASIALAQFDPPAVPRGVIRDEPVPGEAWVGTESYKTGFARGTATFVPFLGSAASRNWPVAFELESVILAGEALPLREGPEPRRAGASLEFDHGTVSARYEPREDGIEQSFRFDTLPRRGALVVRIAVTTELAARIDGDSLSFTGPEGGVAYGRAFAIDAAGERIAVDRDWRDGAIEITVPADFVARARLPLTIDPLVSPLTTIATTSRAIASTDLIWDDSVERYMVCAEIVWSATDIDVQAWEVDGLGAAVAGSQTSIDVTTDSWQAPRIAHDARTRLCLIVAQVKPYGGSQYRIGGRMRRAGFTTMGNQFTVTAPSLADPGDRLMPDVCGDVNLDQSTRFLVVYEKVFSAQDHDIHGRFVPADLDPLMSTTNDFIVDSSGDFESEPRISSTMGPPVPTASAQWAMIVYRRATAQEIRARAIRGDGAMLFSQPVVTGVPNVRAPVVTSALLPDSAGRTLYLAAWQRTNGGQEDIELRLIRADGAYACSVTNLQVIENAGGGLPWDQFRPEVASDGWRFTIAYRENYQNSGDYDVLLSAVHPVESGGTYVLGVTESRVVLANSNQQEYGHGICSRFEWRGQNIGPDPRGQSLRYGLSYVFASGGNFDLRFQQYDGMTATGGFVVVPLGCGPATISYLGTPGLGQVFRVNSNASILVVGAQQSPVTICSGCSLAVNIWTTTPGTATFIVPCDSTLLGATLAFQSVTTGAGNVCFGGMVSLSDLLLVTVR